MKTLRNLICLCLILAIIISCFSVPAEAAVMTAGMLGAGLIAVAAASGAIYRSVSQSQVSLQDWASARIDSWLGGRSIAEAFGAEYIRMAHGKLIIPAVIYNAINDMINDDVTESGVTPGGGEKAIFSGMYYDKQINIATYHSGRGFDPAEISIRYDFTDTPSSTGFSASYNRSTGAITTYIDGVVSETFTPAWGNAYIRESVQNYAFGINNVTDTYFRMCCLINDGGWVYASVKVLDLQAAGDTTIELIQPWEKDVCDVGYQWEGSISGSEADTNIDDLIDTIYKEAVADTLGVIGEIEQETPYPPQPTQYPIDDVLDGMDTINNSINDVGEDVSDAIGNLGDAIHRTIGTVRDTVGEVVDGIAAGVQTLVNTLEGLLDGILEAIEQGPIQLFRFALGAITSVFSTLLQRLAGILGIWHYVVEWFSSITSPFTYFFGVSQSISYNLVLPIYACIAGGIVLAVYKRFGR